MKGNNIKFTYEYVKEYFEQFGYILISKNYERANDKLNCICPYGHEWSVSFNFFKNRDVRCPKCKGVAKYTLYEVKEIFKKENYTLLSDKYEGNLKKMEIECDKGHKYLASLSLFLTGKRCPYCKGNAKHNYVEIKNAIEKDGYKLLSKEYNGAYSKLTVRCLKGHEYEVTWHNFQKGRRCPACNNNYKGEKAIADVLEDIGIDFIRQYSLKELYYKNKKAKLSFDFYIPSLNIAIEYDGEQHFKPIDFAGKGEEWAISQFELTKVRDNIKDEYCTKNNIELIRIPYLEFKNIEKILTHKILFKRPSTTRTRVRTP